MLLVGRLAAVAEDRELPSGDLLTCWRLVVGRPPSTRKDGRRPVTLDTVDCVAWAKGVRRTVAAYAAGDVLVVEGALRRRFFSANGRPASRYEVEVVKARRLAKAA